MNSPLPEDSTYTPKELNSIDMNSIELTVSLSAISDGCLPGLFDPDVNLNFGDDKWVHFKSYLHILSNMLVNNSSAASTLGRVKKGSLL